MLVLAAVPDLQYQRLWGAVVPRFMLARAATWDVALETIRVRPVEIAVVDPALGGTASGQEIERLHLLFPSLRLILYTSMTPQLATVLLALGPCGIRQVLLRGVDDHPERLREIVASEAMHAASHRLLDQLATALAPLPRELRWVLEDALRTPGEVQTILQVAARARVDRGTCARWFTRAGLPSPRHILAAARVLYAHRLLQDPGFTIEDVAKRLGYAQTKTLQQHARAYLGLTAGEMRLSLTADEAAGRIVQSFLTPARSDGSAVSAS
ncbi:MAG TPA: helix-turn-helix domain-containing protein [Gemmatimonadales bacterium]|jgi:AraC-like DNA-binding protein|nr:helix-turn-helix domain-containing protein [Gemmatimonadales bacterium]